MKLIDKDIVLSIIDKFMYDANLEADIASTGECFDEEVADAKYQLCKCIKERINSLEVKEVDLEDAKKEELAQKYIDYTFKRHNIDANSREGQLIYYAYMHGMNQCLNQLKAQKGE